MVSPERERREELYILAEYFKNITLPALIKAFNRTSYGLKIADRIQEMKMQSVTILLLSR